MEEVSHVRPLILALVLTGCVTAADSSGRAEAELAAELQGRSAGAPVACIPASSGTSLDIASADTLVYRTSGTIWVNRLGGRCPGLRPLNRLIIEPSSGGRYCRGDRVRGVEPGSSIPGAVCPLGDFIPYRRP
jgi:hypothetical protein